MMKKPNILIIEDNPISRKVLLLSLQAENYVVVEAPDAASALEIASTNKFDLIIQDLILPDMSGVTLNKKLKELPGLQNIPIIALSGFLNELDKQSQQSDFAAFLLKPVDPSFLLDVVKANLPIATSSESAQGKGKHILIADDNIIQLKLFSMQLRNAGFEVTTALDGVIALQEAKKKPPDAIISDILMPNLDGFGLCLEIKQDPKLFAIPVILLTSHYLEDEDLALAEKVGASRYLTRTPDEKKLILELIQVLNNKSSVSPETPVELTDEIKKKHTIRTIRQLEQQVLDNAKLAQRCALLMSQLSLIGGVTNALTSSDKDIEGSLREVLYFCLDATGISKGALFLTKANNSIELSQQIGFTEEQTENLKSLFGLSSLIPGLIEKNQLLAIPSKNISESLSNKFLQDAKVKSAAIIPMVLGKECVGVLYLGSDLQNLLDESSIEFIRTLGMQFGQSIALASAFDKLGSSEKRYRQLVEISPDAIFIEQEDKFVYVNSAALKLLNAHNSEELLNHSVYDFFPEEYHPLIQEYIQKYKKHISSLASEAEILNLKGDAINVEIVISPFLYQEKEAVYMIMRDITERKLSALYLEIQYAIAWILAESATLYVATAKILKIICERLGWDCGAIWAVDKEDNVLRCTRVWQLPKIESDVFITESRNLTCYPGIGLPGQAWQERRAIWSTDILDDKFFLRKKSAASLGFNTAVTFPIIYENEVLGVIEFFNKKKMQEKNNILLWFESIGNQLGVFLKRKHMEKQMLYLAEHDILTGLSNRSLLEQYLTTAIANAKVSGQKLAVLFLDLDHFKYINDSMGHDTGDLLLKEISERFSQSLRPGDTISRLGGDEFIIILPNVQDKNVIVDIINRLQRQLSNKINLKEKDLFITASIGISLFPDDGNTVQTLIKGADIAMYAAKEKGRNNFQFCTPEMTVKAENQGILQNNLRHALENNEFVLHYQPKIDIATQKVIGMEALIRWQRPDSLLLPGAFISAVEGSELIVPIGEWVLKTAFKQNKIWQEAGLPTLTMSVNLSVRNLNMQLLNVMEQTLAETKLKPNSFEIELTESVLMDNVENNIQILLSLKEMGVQISIDDFGTGYSSLSYLKRFPIDTIKIDQSFVRDIATDPDDAAIVTAIIAMSHSLNFKVIAEGVETEAQLNFLCEHGCDEIQGFYFSRPLAVPEATAFIQKGVMPFCMPRV